MSRNEHEILEHSDHSLLPDEIIIDEILIQLPVKSLCRFKSVSKLWNRVISSTRFAKAHLTHCSSTSNNHSKLVFYQAGKYSFLLDYEALDNQDVDENLSKSNGIDIYGNDNMGPIGSVSLGEELHAHFNGKDNFLFGSSSCGLVCFLVGEDQICVCNPILRQCRIIYVPHSFVNEYSLVVCGFGYVSSIDDFKIVLGGIHRGHKNGTVYVFSLRNNSWRIVQGSDGVNLLAYPTIDWTGKLVNERLHWLTVEGDIYDNSYNSRIFAFDLAHEVLNEILIPKEALSSMREDAVFTYEQYGLSTMGGCLCLSMYRREQGYLQIWMMKQYGVKDSWVRLYDLSVAHGYHPEYYCYHHDKFFGFTKTGKFLIQAMFHLEDNWVYLVDPYQSPPKFTCIWNHYRTFGPTAVNYVESLISPFGFAALTCTTRDERR